MDQIKFAARIKEARTAKGWTQKELAKRLQVTDKAISKWERALSFPDIELLGPISRELDIPLTELLDVEEITPVVENPEEFNSLLEKMLTLMQKKVQQELKRRKKILCIVIAIFIGLSVLVTAIMLGREWYRNQEYWDSKRIISAEEITIHEVTEQENALHLSLSVPESVAVSYDVLTSYWYGKEDPTILYIQFFYFEKPWLLYDSMKEYMEYVNQPGTVPTPPEKELDFPMSVTQVIYCGENGDTILWEK